MESDKPNRAYLNEKYQDICLSCSLTRLQCVLDLKTMNVTYNAAFIVIVASIDTFATYWTIIAVGLRLSLCSFLYRFSHAQLITGTRTCYAKQLAGNGKREGKPIRYLPC